MDKGSTRDLAVDFYVGKLGFVKRRDEPMGPDGRWVEVAPAGAETALVPFTPGLVLACDDIQATFEELRRRGVERTEPPSEQPWGRWAQFRDPDGNEHGLLERPPRRRPGPRSGAAPPG